MQILGEAVEHFVAANGDVPDVAGLVADEVLDKVSLRIICVTGVVVIQCTIEHHAQHVRQLEADLAEDNALQKGGKQCLRMEIDGRDVGTAVGQRWRLHADRRTEGECQVFCV